MNNTTLTVENIGEFEIKPDSARVSIALDVEYTRLTEGVENLPQQLMFVCNILATLKCRIAKSPDSWNPYEMDPFDEDTVKQANDVYLAIKDLDRLRREKRRTDSG